MACNEETRVCAIVPAASRDFQQAISRSPGNPGCARLDHVAAVEQGELKARLREQVADLGRAQRRNPAQTVDAAKVVRSRAEVSMPRSPTITTRLRPKRWRTLSSCGPSVVGSPVLPSKTSTATGQPSRHRKTEPKTICNLSLLAVARVPQLGQWATPALEISRGSVIAKSTRLPSWRCRLASRCSMPLCRKKSQSMAPWGIALRPPPPGPRGNSSTKGAQRSLLAPSPRAVASLEAGSRRCGRRSWARPGRARASAADRDRPRVPTGAGSPTPRPHCRRAAALRHLQARAPSRRRCCRRAAGCANRRWHGRRERLERLASAVCGPCRRGGRTLAGGCRASSRGWARSRCALDYRW